jgi:hypothetical protein
LSYTESLPRNEGARVNIRVGQAGRALVAVGILAAAGCDRSRVSLDPNVAEDGGSWIDEQMSPALGSGRPGLRPGVIITPPSVDGGSACGNGRLEPGEACDPGLHACCMADCSGPVAAGLPCRTAEGACDVEERCDGTAFECPEDVFAEAGMECRAATGDCDLAEHCTGRSADCPDDAVASPDTLCRAVAAVCDAAEYCPGGTGKRCPDDAQVQNGGACNGGLGACFDGVCCPGATEPTSAGGCALEPGQKIVFVTSADVSGGLGGAAEAHALCTELAGDAGLAGSYHAWLSATRAGAGSQAGTGPFLRVDGALVASTAAALTGGTLSAPIERTEANEQRRTDVWTGTSAAGAPTQATCGGWTSEAEQGTFGESGATTASWTAAGTRACDAELALYCVQDDCPGIPVVDFMNDEAHCGACGNACGPQQNCIAGRCGGYVFVTSEYLGGSFGGLAQGDAFCNERATRGNVPGTFTAWLSTDIVQADSRIVDGAYFLLDGSRVADDLAHLRAAGTMPLHHAISLTEIGTIAQGPVWTGTQAGGAPVSGSTCTSWTARTGSGAVGLPSATSSTWTHADVASCSSGAALYCFQSSRVTAVTP